MVRVSEVEGAAVGMALRSYCAWFVFVVRGCCRGGAEDPLLSLLDPPVDVALPWPCGYCCSDMDVEDEGGARSAAGRIDEGAR